MMSHLHPAPAPQRLHPAPQPPWRPIESWTLLPSLISISSVRVWPLATMVWWYVGMPFNERIWFLTCWTFDPSTLKVCDCVRKCEKMYNIEDEMITSPVDTLVTLMAISLYLCSVCVVCVRVVKKWSSFVRSVCRSRRIFYQNNVPRSQKTAVVASRLLTCSSR